MVGGEDEAGEAVPYIGKQTVSNVEGEKWTGAYAWLEIEGCAGCESDIWDSGATVGEFEVIGSV